MTNELKSTLIKLKTLKELLYECAWDGKTIDIHLGLVMSLIHAWKCHTSKLWNNLGRGLWNIKEIFSILSSWDYKDKSKQSFKEDLESIIRKPKLIKRIDTLEVFLLNWWTLIWFEYVYEFMWWYLVVNEVI